MAATIEPSMRDAALRRSPGAVKLMRATAAAIPDLSPRQSECIDALGLAADGQPLPGGGGAAPEFPGERL